MNKNKVISRKKIIFILVVFIGIFACTKTEESGLMRSDSKVFAVVTEEAGLNLVRDSYSHCWGDINGDDLMDLFVINHASSPRLFRNNGDGTFSDITSYSGTNKAGDLHGWAIGDYDNDGDQDIYLTVGAQKGKGYGSNRLFQNDGAGKFTDVAYEVGVTDPKGRGRSVSWVDYNNDGFLDLFIINMERNDGPSSLLKNNGDRTFSDESVESGLDIVDRIEEGNWVDYDNDGLMDLTTAKRQRHLQGEISVYRNFPKGKFRKTQTFRGRTYAWGDYDNDGDLDIFISNPPRVYIWRFEFELLSKIFRGSNNLYENTGEGQFIDVSEKVGFKGEMGGERAIFFDFDNDGDLDIYLLVKGTEKNNINDMIFENNGDKTFSNATEKINLVQNFKGRGDGVAYADYNNDGFLDLFLTNGGMSYTSGSPKFGEVDGPYILYKNNGNQNSWLKIKLIGTKSNRDGIGAHIKLYAGDRFQYRQSNGGMEGFVQHSNIIHFGLGKEFVVDRLEIIWPESSVTNMTDIKANQLLVIREK